MFYGSKENTGFRADIAIDNISIKPGHCWTEVTGQCIVGQTSMLWHLVNVLYDNFLYYDIWSIHCITTFYIITSCQCIVWQPSVLWHFVNVLYDNPLYYDILAMYCMSTLYILTFCQMNVLYDKPLCYDILLMY